MVFGNQFDFLQALPYSTYLFLLFASFDQIRITIETLEENNNVTIKTVAKYLNRRFIHSYFTSSTIAVSYTSNSFNILTSIIIQFSS